VNDSEYADDTVILFNSREDLEELLYGAECWNLTKNLRMILGDFSIAVLEV